MSPRGANIMGHGGAEDAQGLADNALHRGLGGAGGAALLALAAILRDLSASEALRQAMEAFRDGSAPPMALINMISM